MISVLVLTLNEEQNVEACLASVGRADEVIVLDSFSSDKTVEIAKRLGATVVQRAFDNWAAHQNWAMENIEFRHDWVFYIDADERMTPNLWLELESIAADESREEVAYFCGRKNYFMGRWIRHAMPPGMIMRFFKPSKIRFERLVNPTPMIKGPHGYLKNLLEHYNFSKGITEWFDKHNKYSLMEAMEGRKIATGVRMDRYSLFDKDKSRRRQALKQISFRLPFRPLLKFIYMYIGHLGVLDGRPGFTYCVLQAIYEYMIVIKMREMERREKGLPI